VLIVGNLTSSHNFMKLYTRKPPKFLEKSICLFVVHKSNNYFCDNKDETYYKWLPIFIFCNLCYTCRVFSLPMINIVVPLRICLCHGKTEPFSNSVECRYICHALIITPRTYNIWKWIHNVDSLVFHVHYV
jgi:hypothetical protein